MIIGICDDEKNMRMRLEKLCRQILKDMEIQYIFFSDGEEITDVQIDILILDIYMPKMDGLKVKKRYEEQGRDTLIIFVTNHDELMQQAFGRNVVGFIKKNDLEKKFGNYLQNAIAIINSDVDIEGRKSKDILYIKAENIYCRVFMKNGTDFLIRSSLKNMENKSRGTGLVKVHKSYIANLAYVSDINQSEILIRNVKIPISSRMKIKVFNEYKEYCRTHLAFSIN